MSKRRSIVPRAAVVLATLLAAGPLGASRAQAVDAAAALAPIVAADSSAASRPAARSGEGDKVTHERKAQPAATQAGKSAA
ncbi:MAG TPA: hypothetical protein VMH61_01035, partial [Candidatus Acidoferrales bacterium]|nr:hypothetical protein [Candidatus Acidoferrales bacterium]